MLSSRALVSRALPRPSVPPAQAGFFFMSTQAFALGRKLRVYFEPPAAQSMVFPFTGRIELPA